MAKKTPAAQRGSAIAPQPPATRAQAEELAAADEEQFEQVAPATTAAPDAGRAEPSHDSASSARVYRGAQEIDHDLFKLKLARMRKNVSFTSEPEYELIEHVHFFHTVDSNGDPQAASNMVGGHFHPVSLLPGLKPGDHPRLEIGPPMRIVQTKRGLKHERVTGDDHTHDYEYRGSERIRLRQPNMEYAKAEAKMRAAESKVEGVVG